MLIHKITVKISKASIQNEIITFVPSKKEIMASGFFAILDDIAALMDDVAVASKIATKQTAGILGDDLAVNAEKATGFLSSRELPVLWSITKGSFLNKLIIVPIVFLLQFLLPTAIKIILIIGGLYLAYEGVEKIIEYFFHKKESHEEMVEDVLDENAEKTKVKSAITTDFILSIEIVIIALGSVLDKSLPIQIMTVSVVAILATIGVYGIVALIVRMDDAGFKLIKKSNNKGFLTSVGNLLVNALPVIIKALAIIGTIALLLVSGGIFDHNIEQVHHLLPQVPEMAKQFVYGIIAGLVMVAVVTFGEKIYLLGKK
jgi:predicted DNA repair protein MutK